MPKVSVIIPIYNPPTKYIHESLNSVLSQTFRDFEVIVVDDGSSIDTKGILSPYRSHIRYFYKEKGGVNPARAFGLKKALGKYIALNDQDDIWLPDKLQKQVEFLDNYPELDLIFHDFHNFNDQGFFPTTVLEPVEILHKIPCEIVADINSNARIFTTSILYDYVRAYFISQITLMVRKEVCERLNMFITKTNVREFYEFGLRAIHLLKIGYIDETLAHRRIHANNVSHNYEVWYKNTAIICENALNYPWMDARCKDFLHYKLFASYFILGWGFFLKGRFYESRNHFKTIIAHNRLHFPAILRYFLTFISLKDLLLQLNGLLNVLKTFSKTARK